MSKVNSNMSETFVRDDNSGNKIFTKIKDVQSFDIRSLTFQTQLFQIIRGKFNINKFKGLGIKTEDSTQNYLIDFEYIDSVEWEPNEENMKIIGSAMAYIHNYSYFNRNLINLNRKTENYRNTDNWYFLKVEEKYEKLKNEFRDKRIKYLETIPQITNQIKIPLHRDFKPHNILFDGSKYHLIDFDFAAIDFISLEVMAFVVDIIDTGMDNVETFLRSYLKNINIPSNNISYGESIVKENFVTDYLNYLCTNTFPFYLADKLEEGAFYNLVNHRDKAFNVLIENKEKIERILCE